MTILQDIRYALRVIRSSPGYSVAAVLVLGIGIGINAGMFSLVDALVIRPVDLPRQDRLVAVLETELNQVGPWNELSPPNFRDIRDTSRSFELFAVAQPFDYNLSDGGPPEYVIGGRVSEDFFAVSGVQPLAGSFFRAEEMGADPHPIVVLSHELWKGRFAGDGAIIGQTVRLNGRNHTVVGVAPENLKLPFGAQIWTPLDLTPEQSEDRNFFVLFGFALLKPDATVDSADAELKLITARLAREYPETNTGRGAMVWPLRKFVAGVAQNFILLQFGAVMFVLAIVCANVANLQLAQAATRKKEIAMRLALGAGPWRITRQLLTESVVLALAGTGVAVLIAQWCLDLTIRTIPQDMKRWIAGWDNIALDWRALTFAVAIAVLCGLLTGIVPALRSLRPDLQDTLRETRSSAPGGRRLRNALVFAEVALSLTLVIGGALIAKGFFSMMQMGQQHEPASLLTFRLNPPPARDEAELQRMARMHAQVQERIGALPGVLEVSATSFLPHSNRSMDLPFAIEGDAPRPRSEQPVARFQTTLPEYFRALRIPILQGRPIDRRDTTDSELVVVISESLARRHFRDVDPLGRRIRFGGSGPWRRVIGIAGDVMHNWFDDRDIVPAVYLPLPQAPRRSLDYAVRTAGNPLSLVSSIRQEIAKIDADLPLVGVRTMERMIFESFTGLRYSAWVMMTVGVIAVILALVGIYAVISRLVAERTHDIGIRLALGASGRQIRAQVIGESMSIVAAGILMGLTGAAVLAHMLSYFLFGVTPTDWAVYASVTLLFAAAALAASWAPAERAMRVDPMVALRDL